MMDQDELLKILQKRFSTDNKGDYVHVGTAMTLGVVVDTGDPLQQGRLRVFCPALGDNPELILNLPWASYVTPFGGVINNPNFERNGQGSQGAVAYGMWAIPDLGANVIVGCIDGDLRKRYWIGCIYDQQQTHTLFNGRYQWGSGGSVNGPLSSDGNPIQPAYSNLQAAFDGNTSAPEYQTRVGDYTAAAVDASLSQTPNNSGQISLDQQQAAISGDQQFPFNQQIVGGHGYDNSGFMTVPMKSSRVFGWTTPGFHSFMSDDRPFAMKTKLRSATGHMIILDDTNERIRVSTSKGNNWFEMDTAGNIDMYSSTRISIHADQDINLDATGSIRFTAGQGIYGYAGGPSGLPPLPSNPEAGDIRFQAQSDINFISNNFRQLSFDATIFEVGGQLCTSVGGDYLIQVQESFSVLTNTGDIDLTATGNYNLTVVGSINEFSMGGSNISTSGDVNFSSYSGTLNIGAQNNVVIKSISSDVTMQAAGMNNAQTGAVIMKSPNSQIGASDQGISHATTGYHNIQAGSDINAQSNSPPSLSQPTPSNVPSTSCTNPPSDCSIYSGAELAACSAMQAGFRDQALVMAVAIAGAESSYNPNAIGDTQLENAKWGPSLGFWQCRTLKNPSAYPFPDSLRVDDTLLQPLACAQAAYAFSNQGANWSPWSTYTSGAYQSYINTATAAINAVCGNTSALSNKEQFDFVMNEPILPYTIDVEKAALSAGASLSLSLSGANLQSIVDVNMVAGPLSTCIGSYETLFLNLVNMTLSLNEVFSIIHHLGGALLPDLPIPISLGCLIPDLDIESLYMPYINGINESIMSNANFDINGKTIITLG
jgi:uncharacterized protein (DUF2345 family)